MELIKLIIKSFGKLSTAERNAFAKVLTNTTKSFGAKITKQPGINGILSLQKVSERLLNNKRLKFVESFERQMSKLLPKDMQLINKSIQKMKKGQNQLVNSRIPNTPLKLLDIVFVHSSWIDWIAWKPMSNNALFGTLWIRVKRASLQNPSGIYQFPKPNHPHGYGPHVNRSVFLFMCMALGAGKVFWAMFYRSWYNTHRRINYYGLEYKKIKGDTGKRYYIKGTNIRYTPDKISTYHKGKSVIKWK